MELIKNNHNSMKTIVETFLTEETVDLIYDNEQLDKWNSHVESLGLKGQTKISKNEKSPIPFMHLKTSYKNICEQLCPRKENVESYCLTPIPVEILDLIALSKKEGYFTEIQIWYDDKSPDPFCIGLKEEYYLYHYSGVPKEAKSCNYPTKQDALNEILIYDPNFDSTQSFGWTVIIGIYLIGKWADVKHSWKELKEMAIERFKAEKGNDYHKAIKEAKRGLEDLETEAFEKFN